MIFSLSIVDPSVSRDAKRGLSCFLANSTSRKVVVAIDGPAGAGKSTIAKRLAARLGFTYIDTGAMYRAVALWAIRQRVDLGDMHRTEQLAIAAEIELAPGRIHLNGEDISEAIRTQEVSDGASKIAVIPGVRRAMVSKQRAIGERSSVVMEGRDIGTVVFPNADVKIFLDADPGERVRRRFEELRAKGGPVDEAELSSLMKERDKRDSTRADAPLAQAPDAVYLDSTPLSLDEVEEAILKIVRARVTNGKEIR
jgi:CMP/dCMP kinase